MSHLLIHSDDFLSSADDIYQYTPCKRITVFYHDRLCHGAIETVKARSMLPAALMQTEMLKAVGSGNPDPGWITLK